ncbi:hypothetical protein COCON_G00100280 [Conger conger]|uniref:WD repeat and coiled-coil-containing protein n=1 Tax=Conger conger TaxID=82655 RepID=A0A9Q1DMV5_CONCO|nr:hypothetical protein COCON_G00100280 [Conger conger]
MDLGKAKLPRTGLNVLQQAVHPVHGIAWTDGKQVCLTSFRSPDGAEPRFGDTNVIGQFEHVLGLRWAPLGCTGSPALLAVQHKKQVTVWRLQRDAGNELRCARACEASEPLPLLTQGCVWHPREDTLALLTRRDVCVLFSVRGEAGRVRAELREGGAVNCACWAGEGPRLVVAMGTCLRVFVWSEAERTLAVCAVCPLLDVGGSVCALEAVGGAQVTAATELPLDALCGLNSGMAFELPPAPAHSPSPTQPQDSGLDSRRRSVDWDRSLLPGLRAAVASGPVDLTHILSQPRRSEPSLLLQRRDTLTGSGQDSSHLALLTFDPRAAPCRLSIPGILTPDLIAVAPSGRAVAVASNSASLVLVYTVSTATTPSLQAVSTATTATKASPQQIRLQPHERPKGLRFLSDRRLLLMVGRQRSCDPAFLPSSTSEQYELQLLSEDLQLDTEASRDLPAQNPPSLSGPREEHLGGMGALLLPGGVRGPSLRGRRLVEEVRSEGSSPTLSLTDLSDPAASCSSITVETLASEPRGGGGSPQLQPPDPPLPLAQSMERMFARFGQMQHCLKELRDLALNGSKAWGSYPPRQEPPYVIVSCQTQVSESVFMEDRRSVLLCDRKLCLHVLLELFNMRVLEMLHGSQWIVLVADADGFVPLTFRPKEELTVRDGKYKLPRTPGGDTPSDSLS